MLHEGV
jgi:hypothetical protein